MSSAMYTRAAQLAFQPFFEPRVNVAATAERLVYAILRDIPAPQDALTRVGLQLEFEFCDWQGADGVCQTWSGHTRVYDHLNYSDWTEGALCALESLLQQAETTELAQRYRSWRHLRYMSVKLHFCREPGSASSSSK